MFKKLRNRFLLLNLIIISIMMIISFTSIYLITYKNVRNDINMEMNKLTEFDQKTDLNLKEPKLDNNNYTKSNNGKKEEGRAKRSVCFTLIVDNDNNILSRVSVFNMDDGFYETAKEYALENNRKVGDFELDDTIWEYRINPSLDGSGYKITFLDVTHSYDYLRNLVYTFSAVAFVMLIAIFFISKFFANRSIKPIKETFERQKQFIADASHELKTPLAVINTNAEVLLANSEDTIKNQSKWINYIKSETERMTKLTNDLLYLAQADHSDVKLISTDFDLSETIEDVIMTMEAPIFENNMVLDYDIDPNIICHGNSEQIKQVVMILLDNALKYTNDKGKINLTLKKYNNKAIMSVSNTGKGIPAEHLNHLFHRFYRVDKSRSKNSGGYGLGLAIAKSIVEEHSGKVAVKSVVDELTTFTIELPCIGNK